MLVAIQAEEGAIRFFVSRNLPAIASASDLQYLEDLFADLLERAKMDAESLFIQLSSLSVGPLVTKTTGDNTEHPDLDSIWPMMQSLE